MVTLCLGSARQKREYFKKASGAVTLDNVEVLFCASENGRNYFAYGRLPFGDFTVKEYLDYRRALCAVKVEESDILRFGISPRKKLARLCPAQMRIVTYLEKTAGVGDGPLIIYLDGAKYSRANVAALKKLIGSSDEVYVCISDERFLRDFKDAKTLRFGREAALKLRPDFFAAKELAKRLGAVKVAIF